LLLDKVPSPYPRWQGGGAEAPRILGPLNEQGDVAMLTDDVLQGMHDLAYRLHPDNGIELAVTLDACDRIAPLRRMQDRREDRYKFRLPGACLPQYCVYLASDARERGQERRRPGKEPRYRPSMNDSWSITHWRCLRLGGLLTSHHRPLIDPFWKRTLTGFPHARTGNASTA
jgi:hypothetical protein